MKRNLLKFLMSVGLITCQINVFGWDSSVTVKADPVKDGGIVRVKNNNSSGEWIEGDEEAKATYSSGRVETRVKHTYTIKAEEKPGYKFIKWSDNGEQQHDVELSYNFFGEKDKIYTAYFSKIYTIILVMEEGASIEEANWPENSKEYTKEDEEIVLPKNVTHTNPNKHFAGWFDEDDKEVKTIIPAETLSDKTYTAKFVETLTPVITGSEMTTLEVGATKLTDYAFDKVSNSIPATESNGENFYFTVTDQVVDRTYYLHDETHPNEVVRYNAETNKLEAINMGTATITFTQNATSVYEAASKSFQIEVTKATEGTTYVLLDENGFNVNGWGGNKSLELRGPAKGLFYTIEFTTGIADPQIYPRYSVNGSDWTDITEAKTTIAGAYGPIDLSETGAAYVGFRNPGSYTAKFTNIFVTRLNRIKAEAAPIVKTKDADEGTTELMVDWSISNGGNLKLLCDNEHFTLSQAEIVVEIDPTYGAGAITPITVTYKNPEANFATEEAHIIIYNDVHETTVTIKAETVKELGTVTCSDDGWFTFGATEKFQVPEGVEAYTGVLNENKIDLTEVACGSIIEGGQGIVFKAKEEEVGKTFSFLQRYADATVAQENQFKGSSEAVTPNLEANDYYVLGYSVEANQPKGFYHFLVEGKDIPAHKTYIEIENQQGETSAPARLSLGDEATGIQALPEAGEVRPATIYNLSGQRIQRLQRGINIVNGKKVLVK